MPGPAFPYPLGMTSIMKRISPPFKSDYRQRRFASPGSLFRLILIKANQPRLNQPVILKVTHIFISKRGFRLPDKKRFSFEARENYFFLAHDFGKKTKTVQFEQPY